MNKLIHLIALLFITNSALSQSSGCVTNIAALTDSVACGESLFLQQVGVGGASSDDFSGSTLSGLWQSVTSGYVLGGPCGTNPLGGPVLWFASGSPVPRRATTVPVDASCGGNICFDFRMETQGGTPGCDGPDLANEGVYLEYKIAGGAWTQIHYFTPIGFGFTGWQNHCFAIPPAAQTTTTQFRWSQTATSGPTWDFWGIDNVNIATCTGYSSLWSGGSITGYTLDTVTVNPTQSTTYNLMYSNFVDDTCYASINVYVDQPTISASVISSACAGSDTLDAQATVTANCYYELELWNYLPGTGATQAGWSAGNQGGVPIFHNLDVNVNGSLYSNFTMITGNNAATVSYPLYVTDGDVIEAFFTSLGSSANEAMYRIKNSQGVYQVINPLAPPVPAIGQTTQGFPGSIPGDITVGQNNAVYVSCPATANYTYSWTNLTSGGVVGLNPSANIQNPVATVAVQTDFQVIATDSLNPGCTAIDTVTVFPNINNISATLSGPTSICQGDLVTLSWNLVGVAPFDLILNDGTSSVSYQLDAFGFQTNGSGPITFTPGTNTTYSVVSLFDATGCPASVTNPTLSVNVASVPNTGTSTSITLCDNDPNLYDLSTYLGATDPNGSWTGPIGALPPPSPGTSTFNFNPTSDPAGIYTYSLSNAPCPSSFSTVLVNLNTAPSAGNSTTTTYCSNDGIVDLFTLLGPASPTGIWSQTGTGPSLNFDPSSSSPGNYDYTVTDPTGACSPVTSTITVNVNSIPTSNINSSSTVICAGECIDLIFNLTGSAPFNLTYTDPNPVNVVLNAAGNDNTTNLPVNICPPNSTNLSIVSVTDANGCSNTSSSTIGITVNPGPFAGNSNSIDICADDVNIYQLQNLLGGSQNLSGYWTLPSSTQLPNNPNFNFDPQTMQAGNYTYTVTAAPCNPSVATVTVNLVPVPSSGSSNNTSICINDYSSSNTYDLFNLINNGDPGGFWYVGNSASGSPISPNIDPNSYGVGNYDFTYEVNGIPPCANSSTTVTLTINPEPVVNTFTANPLIVSQGNTTTLSIDMLTGSPPFIINGSDNATPSNLFQINTNASMQGTTVVTPTVIVPYTTYSLSNISDANGCSTTSPLFVNIDVEPYPVINPFTTMTPNICEGNNASITMTLSQGEAPVTVNYSINGNNFSEIIGTSGQATPISVNIPIVSSLLQVGNNSVSITSVVDASGQNSPANEIPSNINIAVNENPSVNLSISSTEICDGDPVNLIFNFTSGNAPYSVDYTVNSTPQTPISFASSGNQNYNLNNPYPLIGTNSYQVISVTDINGCTNTIPTQIVDVIVNEIPNIDIAVTGNNPLCFGESSEISFPVFSGTAPFSVIFSDGINSNTVTVDNNGLVNGSPLSINPSTNTTYSIVSVVDDKGCSSSSSNNTSIIVNEIPFVSISGNNELCQGEMTQLYFNFTSGSAPWTVNYSVNGVPTSVTLSNINDSISVSPNSSSIYDFTSVADLSCSNNINDQVSININPVPTSVISGGGSVCDDGSQVDVLINTSSGTPPFNAQYSVGIETKYLSNIGYNHTISTNDAGLYSLIEIFDSKGCKANTNGFANVYINPIPQADFTFFPQPVDLNNPLVFFVDQSTSHSSGYWDFGDNSPYVNTNFGEISHLYSSQDSGTYNVTLTISSDSGCTNSITKQIIVNKSFSIYIPDAFSPNNDLKNDHYMPIVDGTKSFEFSIYNRFGQKVFSSDIPSNNYCYSGCESAWNGKFENSDEYAPAGHYAYSIIAKDINGKKYTYEGTLTLIR